jgi:peptidyl-prolyl cis-trans isomerase SurA
MMKRAVLLVFIFCLFAPFPSAGEVFDRVVGVVDGEVITLSDLDEAILQYRKFSILDEGNPLDKKIVLRQTRKEVLAMLIEERLLQGVANRFDIKVEDEEIDKTIERMKQAGNVSDDQMIKQITVQGFSLEGYRHFLKVQIRKAKIIEIVIKPQVTMAEEKIREYYQSHLDTYLYPEVRVSQILIQVPSKATPIDWEQAKKKMEGVLQSLREGTAFEEAASLNSDDSASVRSGGDLGFFKKGEMVPELEAVVFAMKKGEVSRIIQSSQGLHILKVTEIREGSIAPFDEIKEQVMGDYYREEVTRLYAKWLEDLKNRSKVEVKL